MAIAGASPSTLVLVMVTEFDDLVVHEGWEGHFGILSVW